MLHGPMTPEAMLELHAECIADALEDARAERAFLEQHPLISEEDLSVYANQRVPHVGKRVAGLDARLLQERATAARRCLRRRTTDFDSGRPRDRAPEGAIKRVAGRGTVDGNTHGTSQLRVRTEASPVDVRRAVSYRLPDPPVRRVRNEADHATAAVAGEGQRAARDALRCAAERLTATQNPRACEVRGSEGAIRRRGKKRMTA